MKSVYKIDRNFTELGEYLVKARVKAGLTQKQVSDHLGYCSAQFISNFERGIARPSLKKATKLKKLLKLNSTEFVRVYLRAEETRILKAMH